jgi:rhodanese-related sulfurtransferase
MTMHMPAALLLGSALLGAAMPAHAATASLRDDAQLMDLLTKSPQCCVIDARSAQRRKDAELPGALAYAEGLRIKPTSAVIVLADNDARAMNVAKALAKGGPHPVYAVKGGYLAWQSVELRLQAQADRAGTKFSFVIPHDTCQQGTPLHVFEAQPARPGASKPK